MKSDIDKMRERFHDAREVLALLDEAHGRWAYWRERCEELERENEELRAALGRILENEASDWKAVEAFGGYILDDELREEARALIARLKGDE